MTETNHTATASDGTAIVYEVSGVDAPKAPTVLLVHGITECRRAWTPVIDRLESDFRVVAMDLRGHGESATAERYDLEAMGSDVVAVMLAAGLDRPHLVGHSLGAAVVSAVGAAAPVASVVNVDQSLQLGEFKAGLMPVEALLRDAATFGPTIDALFGELAGSVLSATEVDRLNALRRPDQEVVLGVWELLFTMSADEVNAVVDAALAGFAGAGVPYLAIMGADPGDGYAAWLASAVPGAIVELWADHGHYPHLVDPDRFVARLTEFWSGTQAHART